ncbi:MAG: hypothetical protein QOD57_2615 [Actinomycetota bacterium]|jgi:hypothetical protein|nr:hypothetical protein [Actinomycetota bacterium]MDQ1504888.1 hypothetical protein [Actinomycetota bacterium]
MGASKESPATELLEWAVHKLDEASKTDWVEKFNALASSKPAYLRNAVMTAAPSLPAPAPAPSGGPSQADVDAALHRAAQAEAKAETLARKVAELEQKLAGANSHREVTVPDDEGAHDDDEHKSHWWSRHH